MENNDIIILMKKASITRKDERTQARKIFESENFFKVASCDLRQNNLIGLNERLEFLKSYKTKNFALNVYDMKSNHFNFLKAYYKQMGKFNQALKVQKEINNLTRLYKRLSKSV